MIGCIIAMTGHTHMHTHPLRETRRDHEELNHWWHCRARVI